MAAGWFLSGRVLLQGLEGGVSLWERSGHLTFAPSLPKRTTNSIYLPRNQVEGAGARPSFKLKHFALAKCGASLREGALQPPDRAEASSGKTNINHLSGLALRFPRLGRTPA